jgi:amino acid adenylation domain-containing protein
MSVQDKTSAGAIDPIDCAAETVLAGFRRMAARHPDRAAVRSAGRQLTYQQLDRLTDDLAARLVGLGTRGGDVIGVRGTDRLDYVTGPLAAWKSGGVYLPLEPADRAGRNERLLAETAARIVLDNGGTGLPEQAGVVLPVVVPEQLAYLIFTSGTTGRPKGVGVAHGPLAAHVAAIGARFDIRSEDVVLHFARPTADVAVEQLLTALTVGACLVLPERQLLSIEEFLRMLAAERVTVANLPAGYLHDVVAMLGDGCSVPGALRTMISGSDRLSPQAAATWTARTGVRLVNAYGPTEGVITATVCDVTGERTGYTVPIGTPVGDRAAYLLDERLRPVADGAVGELFLGGGALAAGYLGQPGGTADLFIPDPFASRPGSRMYRTGDLVRKSCTGELEFLGRRDDQVKIRGFRVELGEVRVALAAHPSVDTCAIVMRGTADGGGQLAAYVTVTGPAPGYPELREFLACSLPDHMIPATVTVLDVLPLTPAGQVDRIALPEPALPQPADMARRTPTEQLLAGIWADVLGVPDVGAGDNFFHLGGDSLTAVRVAGRVHEVFGSVSPAMIFDAPTLADFAAAVQTQLSGGSPTARPGPTRVSRGTAPLSRFQRGLWLLDCWEPGTCMYNVPWVFGFAGPIDPDLIDRALRLIVSRHEALRTTFEVLDTVPYQVIHDQMDIPFQVSDLSALPAADREAQLEALIRADARQPFDLITGPLVRARLVPESDRTASLILVFHHIVWDEGSLAVLDRELREIYLALAKGQVPQLPELDVQYADYTSWLQDEGTDDVRPRYWAEHLRGAPTRPALAPDHPRPAEPAFRSGYHRFAIDAEQARRIREFARHEAATPFMVLLAGLVLAVHRRCGETDLVVGTPVSVRDRAELDALIGYFINVIPLRFRLDAGMTVRDLLGHVRDVALGGYQNQQVPLEDIVGAALDERSGERHPLFQLVFEMHTADPRVLPIGEAALTRRLHFNEVSRFDLSWSVEDDGTSFTGRIEYDTALFEPRTLAELGAEWEAALAVMVVDPDLAVDLLPLPRHPAPEPALTGRDAGLDVPVHVLFEEQARKSPAAVALVSGETELTYAELNARANRVARYLRARDVAAGAVAAVLVDRGAELVVGLLAVLKAGAGYTLLDPELPARRQARMVADSGARVVLTGEMIAQALAGGGPAGNLDLRMGPDAVACVMFTSGSTGRPKCVAASHRALVGTYVGQDYAMFGAGEVWLQCSPVSWDAFGLELFGALLFGGTCVLHPGQRPDPETMASLIARHGVTQLQVSASLFNFLVDEFPQAFSNLRRVFTGGERASVAHLARLLGRFPGLTVVNGYGPVESMGFTTCHVVGEVDLAGSAVPIGVPIARKGVYVLDETLRHAAPGRPVEIYATGAGLALGYLRQPGLTAERFVPDPFGPAGSRMYRTGDLGQWNADGSLAISGRLDDQVKIRGFRVEPGEVAAALGGYPGVNDCAVVARAPGPGELRLAAYLTTNAAAPPSYAEISDYLAGLLPDYMIPSSVTVLDALPLSPNGKIDRTALPEPVPAPTGADLSPASTDSERLVAAIWAEILGVDQVGAHDNFFGLGGNSLAAVRVALRLSRETGTRIPPRLVFAARTVRELARRLPASSGPCPPGPTLGTNEMERP